MSEKLNMTNSITTKYYWGLWWSWSYGSWIYNYLCSQCCEFESSSGECAYMLNVYKSQLSRQTGSRNLTGQKKLPTKWGTCMKLVTKYQICVINSCWEKCAYMFNVYKNQLSRQTGSKNLTKYQISAIDSRWEKCDEKYLGWTEGWKDGKTNRGKTVYPPPPMSVVIFWIIWCWLKLDRTRDMYKVRLICKLTL